MKVALKNTAFIFLAAMLIMATGGYSIYHHICHCAGESTASIFIESACDHEDMGATAGCCDTHQAETCCSHDKEGNASNVCHAGDCCNTSVTFLKISDNFTVSLEKISLKFTMSFISILFGHEILSGEQVLAYFQPETTDIPPPPSGTELIISLHQLKIAHTQV